MSLENRIRELNNPQYFSKICKAVLQAEYPNDYQPVDDDRPDGGNDGYISSQKRMFARHCFKNPTKRKQDSEILKKLRGDFAKAVELRNSGKFEVEKWTFLTNYPVSNAIVVAARAMGKKENIQVDIQEAAYVTNLLLKHKHLLSEFPEINEPLVLEEIQKNTERLEKIIIGTKSEPEESEAETEIQAYPVPARLPSPLDKKTQEYLNKDKDYLFTIQFAERQPTAEEKNRLKALVHSSSNRYVQEQAAFALFNWYDVLKERPDEYISYADIGIRAAEEIGRKSEIAIMYAEKAKYVGAKQVELQIKYSGAKRMNEAFGLFLQNPQNLEQDRQALLALDEERRKIMVKSMDVAQEANDLKTYGLVMLFAGQTTGSLGSILDKIGDKEAAAQHLALCKKLFAEAKNCFEWIGDRESRAYALHNLANQLRFFGEEKVAKEITNEVIKEAKEMGLQRLEKGAMELLDHIENGIPDHTKNNGSGS